MRVMKPRIKWEYIRYYYVIGDVHARYHLEDTPQNKKTRFKKIKKRETFIVSS